MRISDWISDVCSSDLAVMAALAFSLYQSPLGIDAPLVMPMFVGACAHLARDRKSVVEGKSVLVRVELGGRRIIQKKQTHQNTVNDHIHKVNYIHYIICFTHT